MAHSDVHQLRSGLAPWRRALGAPGRGCASVAAVLLLGACTELAPGGDRLPQQFQSVQPPDAGPPPDERWGCLEDGLPMPAAPLVRTVELALTVIDTVTQAPPPGLTARACSRLDAMCATPLTPNVSPAVDGALHLDVPQQFDGFVEITSPSTVPTMYFINRNLMRNTTEAFGVIGIAALAGLAAGGNVTLDPTLGNVLIRTFDCQRQPAGGVQLSNDKGGLPFSFVNGLPVVGRDETTPDGVGGFVNVPVDYVVLQGIVTSHGEPLSTASVITRASWFSYGDVEPLPE